MEERNETSSQVLYENLKKWEGTGVRLYLDGVPASLKSIEQNCVMEDSMYMPDYVTDQNGKITEIRYDRISLK